MANRLVASPVEIKTAIFQYLNDLDDALHLSQVCKNLRDVFATEKVPILKQIIV